MPSLGEQREVSSEGPQWLFSLPSHPVHPLEGCCSGFSCSRSLAGWLPDELAHVGSGSFRLSQRSERALVFLSCCFSVSRPCLWQCQYPSRIIHLGCSLIFIIVLIWTLGPFYLVYYCFSGRKTLDHHWLEAPSFLLSGLGWLWLSFVTDLQTTQSFLCSIL